MWKETIEIYFKILPYASIYQESLKKVTKISFRIAIFWCRINRRTYTTQNSPHITAKFGRDLQAQATTAQCHFYTNNSVIDFQSTRDQFLFSLADDRNRRLHWDSKPDPIVCQHVVGYYSSPVVIPREIKPVNYRNLCSRKVPDRPNFCPCSEMMWSLQNETKSGGLDCFNTTSLWGQSR